MTHVGRYAPSPSGDLHLGNARTALLAWLWARGDGGRFLLRIEDLDPDRSRPALVARIIEQLEALGIDWDGDPVWQSRRGALYARALERLERSGLA
jgi:glutamyl-tRNA synthetase